MQRVARLISVSANHSVCGSICTVDAFDIKYRSIKHNDDAQRKAGIVDVIRESLEYIYGI